jgi:nucleotide-binding universal stress UspA family protein
MKKILVAVDLSPFSEKAVEQGSRLAALLGAELTILNVVNDVVPYFEFFPIEYSQPDYFASLQQRSEEQLTALASKLGAEGHRRLVSRGQPPAEIVRFAKEESMDLIVMASHGHSGLEHALLGSVTEKVLRKAHCSVLVVR